MNLTATAIRARVALCVAWVGAWGGWAGTAATPAKEGASYDYWLTGSAADANPARTRAGLFLSGGGGDVTAAWKWFVACAGGGDIVVLRASGADGYNDYVFSKIGGVDSVESIRFNTAAAASDPRVLAIIAKADGIFLAGGDQARYVNYWKDTSVGAALNAHLRAGKPLGGTSAGLAVLGQYYFSALHDSVTSATALANPFDQKVTVGRDFLAAPALVGVITDSHFMARQRLGRLVAFLARMAADEQGKPARVVGLGVDEATALCVEPDGQASVFSEKQGLVWLVAPTRPPEVVVPGQALVVRGVRVVGLGPASALNLTTLAVERPAVTRMISAAEGKLSDEVPAPSTGK